MILVKFPSPSKVCSCVWFSGATVKLQDAVTVEFAKQVSMDVPASAANAWSLYCPGVNAIGQLQLLLVSGQLSALEKAVDRISRMKKGFYRAAAQQSGAS